MPPPVIIAVPEPRFFQSSDEFRAWLEEHHASAKELLVGFRKAHVRDRGLTYAEALDQALCHGWIDGVRRSLGADSWSIRFTPRSKASNWSEVNIRRMHELLAQGVVAPAGRAAFERRDEAKSASYSYEQRTKGLDAAHEREFQRHREAWAFYSALAPSYRRATSWWVMSAKREETRAKRLRMLIEASARGERLDRIVPPARAGEAKREGVRNTSADRRTRRS